MTNRKKYMKRYNQRNYVKEKKAKYMQNVRKNANKIASKKLVQLFLDMGFEDLAFEYALERAPDMLIAEKVGGKPIHRK